MGPVSVLCPYWAAGESPASQSASQLAGVSTQREFSEHQLHAKPCGSPREAVGNQSAPCLRRLTVWWERWRKGCPWVGLGHWRGALRTVGAEGPVLQPGVSLTEMAAG